MANYFAKLKDEITLNCEFIMNLYKKDQVFSRSKAIRLKCLECSGGRPKEVTLCNIVKCPLWPFRFGYSFKDKRYRKRMEAAKRNYPERYQGMLKLLTDSDEK